MSRSTVLGSLFGVCWTLAGPAAAQMLQADSAFAAANWTLADSLYSEILDADPWNSRATYQLAVLRRDRPPEALALFQRYTELEPTDLWGFLALASQLERMGRVDDALSALEPAARLNPDEEALLALQGHLYTLAGRYADALDSYRAAQSHAAVPDEALTRRIRWLGGETAPAFWPTLTVSRDTDGNVVTRGEVGGDAAIGARTRLGITLGYSSVSDGVSSKSVRSPAATLAWRPRTHLRLDGKVGVAWIDGSASSAPRPWEADLRLRWRPSGGRGGLEVRAQRLLLGVSPDLLTTGAVRTEGRVRADLPLGTRLSLRAAGRVASYNTALDTNRRVLMQGGAVLQVFPAGEVSIQVHSQHFQRPTASAYFAPDRTLLAEMATYVELEGAGPWMFVVDAGTGAQRIAEHGGNLSGWGAAFRADLSATYAFRGGRAVRLGVEAYDASIGDAVTWTRASWRYVALSAGLRWSVR